MMEDVIPQAWMVILVNILIALCIGSVSVIALVKAPAAVPGSSLMVVMGCGRNIKCGFPEMGIPPNGWFPREKPENG